MATYDAQDLIHANVEALRAFLARGAGQIEIVVREEVAGEFRALLELSS